MLRTLQVRDFAIVDAADAEFGPGMTVFTGETGAGKSILVEALGIVLGDRADVASVRAGAERASVTATFDLTDSAAARDWLAAQDLSAGRDCILRRQIGADGRSRAYINDTPVTVQALRDLAERLVDICGQSSHQSIVRRDAQRDLLDGFGGHAPERAAMRDACAAWRALAQQLEALAGRDADGDQRDYLEHQLRELEQLALTPEDYARIELEHRRLAHARELLADGRTLADALSEEGGPRAQLAGVARRLQELQRYEPRLAGIAQLLDSAGTEIDEAASDLERVLDAVEVDPHRLAQVEERIAALHACARKHRVAPHELMQRRTAIADRLMTLSSLEETRDRLASALSAARIDLDRFAAVLTEKRRQSAVRMGEAITTRLQELGMEGARFTVLVEPEPGPPGEAGADRITFVVSTNPGQPLMPLARIASGGEVARISLAVQVATASDRSATTLVFDEVDVGIGGRVAEIVGRYLRALGERRQVLCVTHHAQVAVHAAAHYRVEKHIAAATTATHIERLEVDARVDEVARMLGGLDISPQTLLHARSLLEAAARAPRRRAS